MLVQNILGYIKIIVDTFFSQDTLQFIIQGKETFHFDRSDSNMVNNRVNKTTMMYSPNKRCFQLSTCARVQELH